MLSENLGQRFGCVVKNHKGLCLISFWRKLFLHQTMSCSTLECCSDTFVLLFFSSNQGEIWAASTQTIAATCWVVSWKREKLNTSSWTFFSLWRSMTGTNPFVTLYNFCQFFCPHLGAYSTRNCSAKIFWFDENYYNLLQDLFNCL